VDFDEDEDDAVPDEVIELVRSGNRLEAIRVLRELTGADPQAAREVIRDL
jgi:hypothetical protein